MSITAFIKPVVRYLRRLLTGAAFFAIIVALGFAVALLPWRLGSWVWQLCGHRYDATSNDAFVSWWIGAGIPIMLVFLSILGKSMRLSKEDYQ